MSGVRDAAETCVDEVKSAITPRESTAIRRKRGWIAAMAGSGFASYRRGPEVFQTDDKGLGSLRIPAMEVSEINGAGVGICGVACASVLSRIWEILGDLK